MKKNKYYHLKNCSIILSLEVIVQSFNIYIYIYWIEGAAAGRETAHLSRETCGKNNITHLTATGEE